MSIHFSDDLLLIAFVVLVSALVSSNGLHTGVYESSLYILSAFSPAGICCLRLTIALESDPLSSLQPRPGKLARYVNTPEAMERFRRHYGVPDDVHLAYRFWEDALTGEPGDLILPLVAVIEGGVRFPIDPLLADFLDFFRISPTQVSPNIFRIVMGVVELNPPVSLPDTNKEMTDDFLLVRGNWYFPVRGNWYFPGHRCPTVDGRPEEKKKQVQPHLTNPVALKAVYDSEVCVDEYANPRSAYKLLRYIPSARSFLQTSVQTSYKNLAEALANPANQSPPAHDIRDMAGINLKKLLPPVRTQAVDSEPVLPLNGRRKRKGAPKGEASQAVTLAAPDTVPTAPETVLARPVLPGIDTLPSNEETDVEVVGPFVPSPDPDSSMVLAPFWAPSLETQGERVRTDATVLRTGGSGSSTATALCEVARLLGDMAAVQGSLELGDRFQRQAAKLENSLELPKLLSRSTRSFDFRNEAERMRREVEAYKDQVRTAILKRDEANLKLEDTEDLLRNALEVNSKAKEKFKALEADIVAKEKAAFDRGSVQAQTTMTKQLPGIYNEAFQQGWKALYSWPESDDMPQLPPRENLPYLKAPVGVPEEELSEPQPSSNEEAGPSNA
uniref:Aminotransferase-like plant mobile domain-containing protein n=1 Tax=Fagus sylvatica TaxID=28930 RepID=A0A2N9G9I8_FAGSY